MGCKVKKMTLPNGVVAWGMSPSKYIQEAVQNCEKHLDKQYEGCKMAKKVASPYAAGYEPELDISEPLGPDDATYFQSQISVLRWMIELGRIDIITEVSKLASQLAQPREGHLEAVFHVYAHLRHKHNSRLCLDPTYPEIDKSIFMDHDWKTFYGDVKEAIPENAPEPRGKEVDLCLYCDSDHAGDQIRRRSRTGYLVFMNMAPVVWYSKKQATIETSVFGAEFVALKN